MRPAASLFALGTALASTLSGRALTVAEPLPPLPHVPAPRAPVAPAAPAPAVPWAAALPAIRFVNTRTAAAAELHLYTPAGALDEEAAAALDGVAAEKDAAARPLDRRLVRLLVKAATHFHAGEIDLVSTFRDNARGGSRHRSGEAADFRLPGVTALRLAAYLRTGSRVGVGVYTHPRTQFVHLDVRDESFHWGDASPPGRVWRESRMTDRAARVRDAAYAPEQDLPETAR